MRSAEEFLKVQLQPDGEKARPAAREKILRMKRRSPIANFFPPSPSSDSSVFFTDRGLEVDAPGGLLERDICQPFD
jgi:hypothetical protein